jgi:hypothetical protein
MAVTRETVLEVAAGLRADEPGAAAEQKVDGLVRAIIASTVSVGDDLVDYTAYPTSDGAAVTGVLIDVSLTRTDSVDTRSVATVALAATRDDDELVGSVVLSGLPIDAADGARTLHTAPLSGDVQVSAPVDVAGSGVLRVELAGAASVPPAPPAQPAPTPRTPAERQAAKKAYDAALKVARTKYAKARKKAKRSKRKRIAAKKAYDQRKARAKAAYRAAIADVPAAPTTSSPAAPSTADGATVVISTDVGWAANA